MKGNSARLRPPAHRPIARISQTIPRLFVRPQFQSRKIVSQALQDLHRLAHPYDERLTPGRERIVKFDEAILNESPVNSAEVWGADDARLHDVEGQDGSAFRGFGKGLVVVHSQVALEPNDLHRTPHLCFYALAGTESQ